MAKTSQTYDEEKIEKGRHRFIVYFLYDDEEQTVRVEETEELDFLKVFRHLNIGGSVFITHRRILNKDPNHSKAVLEEDREELKKPWYFAHI